ncbi:MAG: hypothetical protein ACK5C4_15335, partial [Pseudanabaena sp.]
APKKTTSTSGLAQNTPQPRGAPTPPNSILGFWFVLAKSFFAIEQLRNTKTENGYAIFCFKNLKPK